MNHQNLLLQDDPFAAPDSIEHLPSHPCAVVITDIDSRQIAQNVRPKIVGGFVIAPGIQACYAAADHIAQLERQLAEASKDAERMDAIDYHRIEVIPEYEGLFEARAYQYEGESYSDPQFNATGKTAREAIDKLLLRINSDAAMKEQA